MNRKPYPEYKNSGVQWLGEVPRHWEALPFRRLIKFVKTGTTPSGAEEYHFEEEGFNWYSPSDFTEEVYLGVANRKLSAEGKAEVRIFPAMTVMLVGIGATIGKVGLSTNKSSCNQQINAIICNNILNPVFAAYSLKTMRDFIVKCGKFTTMPIINQDETKNLILAVPPLPEQTAIANFLDREAERIDTLVAKKRRLIALLGEKRTALISRTVTRGLPAEAALEFGLEPHTRFKDSGIEWLGEVPEGWEVVPLAFLVTLKGGATPDKSNSDYWEGSIPWISPKDMKVAKICDAQDHVSKEALRDSALVLLPENSVLIVVRGMILAHSSPVALTTGPVTINQDMKALICGSKLFSQYLAWLLMGCSKILVSLADESAHGTRKLDTATLTRFPASLPSLPEQTAIAAYLDRETAKIDQLVTKIEAVIARLQEYRTALITAAVTGKIDVRGYRHSRACGSPEEVL